jgi:subtilisin family serine protease
MVTKKLLTLITVFVLIPLLSFAESKKYIVLDNDVDSATREVEKHGGHKDHSLQYHHGFVADLPEEAVEKIKVKLPGIIIEEDYEAHIAGFRVKGKASSSIIQPAQSIPWGINKIQARDANLINRGNGVVVCVVDTGIDTSHPDLLGQVIGGQNFVVSRGRIDPTRYKDDNGHGTHVSGTIAALDNNIGVVGVAPEAKLLAMKVLNSKGSGSYSAIAEGIRACISKGAHVISMSLGGSSDSTTLHSAISDAATAGIVIVAAAGNESGPVSYPAKYSEVLAVSATDSSNKIASFSNTGPEVDYAAPGVAVTSTVAGGGYDTWSGTSMATPHVAGVVALKISSGSLGLVATNIGLTANQQGHGLINALLTVNNH